MATTVKILATGKTLLTDASSSKIGRVVVHVPKGATINTTFVGRPNSDALTADDDVTLSYYTPASDTLAATAISNAGTVPVQVAVKADGNLVYANVASGTFPVTLVVVPLDAA